MRAGDRQGRCPVDCDQSEGNAKRGMSSGALVESRLRQAASVQRPDVSKVW